MLSERFKWDGKSSLKLSKRQIEAKRRVEDETESILSSYRFENYLCECGAGEEYFETLAEKDRYGFKVKTVICRKCGLMMTNPRMTQDSYNMFYDLEYGKLYRDQDQDIIDDSYFSNKVLTGKYIYNFVRNHSDVEFNEVLEIGCAAGGILQYFKDMGCNVTGCDLGSTYIEWGKEKGLNLLKCNSYELLKYDKKYDLIILNHVFEHFLDIEKEVDVISKLLSANGILYIAVPGVKALTYTYNRDLMLYLQNAHVRHFTLRTLESVMNRYGFGLSVGNEEVQAIFKYTGIKRCNPHNYYVDTMKFLFELEDEYEKNMGYMNRN